MKEYLGLFIFFTAAILLLCYIGRIQLIEKENALLQKNISQVRQFYDELQERVNAIRKYRHDLRKHIRIVEQFLEESRQIHLESEEDYKDLHEMLRDIEEDINRSRKTYCEDEVIDAICKIKAEECEEAKVPFVTQISLTKESLCGFDPYHLTGILMNLLDNALEAEKRRKKGTKRGVTLRMAEEGEGIFFLVGNDVPENFVPDFKTTKKNRDRHGFGISIARDYSRLYNGELHIRYDEEEQYCEISTVLRPRVKY